MSISRRLPATITLALRSSALSRTQFGEFSDLWASSRPNAVDQPQLRELVIDSPGDRDKTVSMLEPGIPDDFFTRDLDQAVLAGRADAALHSAKDLPWPLPKGLEVWTLGPRAEPHDELCSLSGWSIESLPLHARVGTSSPERQAQLLALRPDLVIVSLRGTIAERLTYLDDQRADAIVVAACALRRLKLPAGVPLPFSTHPLQGHLAVVGPRNNPRLRQAFGGLDVRRSWGNVTLLGAGPGPVSWLTLRARSLMESADIIYYDALLDPAMLAGLKAETVFVGKRRGKHEKTQDETNELLYQSALSGKRVVRLKGGDPLIFGRGSEEAAYLGRRLVDYEIVSGISSPFAASSTAGIPLSERHKATSVAFVNASPADKLRWTTADTQVFFMPSAAAATLARLGAEAGVDPKLGIAWIRGAASERQTVVSGTFDQLESLQPPPGDDPVLLITGPTIDQRSGNDWFDRLPRILHTGVEMVAPDERKAATRGLISYHPFIRFETLTRAELAANGTASQLLPPLQADWLVFTSPRTVRCYFELLASQGFDSRSLAGIKIAAIGHSTAAELALQGIRPDLQPELEHSQGLIAAFAAHGVSGCRILLPRSDRGLDLIPTGLRAAGNEVLPLILYRTLPPLETPAINPESFDEVIFTSPSTVENFFAAFPNLDRAWLDRVAWHTRGPQTRDALDRILSTRLA